MQLRRVVVTGLGALTPIGNTRDAYWEGLIDGVSGAAPITLFDAEKFKTRFACEVKNFSALDFFDRKEARKLDRYHHLSVASADEAIADAQLDLDKVDKDMVGVVTGGGIGGINSFYEEVRNYVQGDFNPRFNPFFIPKQIIDIAPGIISMKYGFRGPNYSTVSACASASHALQDAYNLIRLGDADVIVSGGAEAAVSPVGVGGFNAMRALSERNDDYQTASRPFDASRDGFVLGEGASAIILEEYEHARARGAKIYAEIVAVASTADAYHMTAPHPEGTGIIRVMQNALKKSGLQREEIDYINVHGTSTPLGDTVEVKAIQKVFGDHAYKLNISSTKSMTGHLLGAAGAIEAAACLLSIERGMVPPTINHTTTDPAIDPELNLTINKAQKREVNVAISNTFGFGGHNCSIIFSKVRDL